MSTTKTGIEWTDRTWNPVRGCSRISEGCRNCYAERVAARFSDQGGPFHLFADRHKSGSKWTGKVHLVRSQLDLPLRWRKPAKIFVNSMSDLFHESLSVHAIADVFRVMADCPQHTFQVLTKRAELMHEILADERLPVTFPALSPDRRNNVWLGVSVEDQKTANERIPWLLRTPAAVRFVSYEPALGPVDFGRCYRSHTGDGLCDHEGIGIDWVIAGGESGPGARPAHPDWFRDVRDQCVDADVPFLFKQWGQYLPLSRTDGIHELPFGEYNTETKFGFLSVGKRKAGRLLDGVEWSQFPEVRR